MWSTFTAYCPTINKCLNLSYPVACLHVTPKRPAPCPEVADFRKPRRGVASARTPRPPRVAVPREATHRTSTMAALPQSASGTKELTAPRDLVRQRCRGAAWPGPCTTPPSPQSTGQDHHFQPRTSHGAVRCPLSLTRPAPRTCMRHPTPPLRSTPGLLGIAVSNPYGLSVLKGAAQRAQ